MKCKLMMILSIFFVVLLAVSTVNAADDVAGDVVGVDNDKNETTILDNSMSNNFATDEELTLLGDDFDDLQASVDNVPAGSVLVLDRDYTKVGSNPIRIHKDLTIDGTGHTINCNGDYTAFYSDYGKITLKNLKIINGHNNKNYMGGAIYIGAFAQYTLENCTFEDNWAEDYGGAIYNSGTNPLRIINCHFNKNKVEDDDGGAIYSVGELYIENSIFEDNCANDYGGAIYAEGNVYINNNQNVQPFNSFFSKNTASDNKGGAIFAEKSIIVKNAVFSENSAEIDGGAIYSVGELYIENSIFADNCANDYGGAIYVEANISAIYTNFISNKACPKGGAIYAKGNVNIKDCTFEKNNAKRELVRSSEGGAIYSESDVYVNNDDPYIISFNSFFIGNNEGGAIYSKGKTFVKNTKFTNNERAVDGGAIFSENNVQVINGFFESNKANFPERTNYGGAICCKNELTVMNSTFISNWVDEKGGAIYAGEIKEISGSIFENNYADDDEGGAIYADKINKISDSTFTNNLASYDNGGAIYAVTIDKISYSTFTKNKAISPPGSSGGAIYADKINEISYSTFTNNEIDGQGGAIYANKINEISHSTFKNNKARIDQSKLVQKNHGGAIYSGTIDKISYSTFTQNKAENDDGGAIYISKKCDSKIYNCLFEKNSCGDEGGAIYIDSQYSNVGITHCSFADNTAADKGQSVYNCGEYATVSKCWYGINSPDFTDQFKIWHGARADEDYIPSEYVKIGLEVVGDSFYKGNTYWLSAYFYLNTNPGERVWDIPFSELEFYGDAEFSNPDNHHELTKNVTFKTNDAVFYATLNHEIVGLKINNIKDNKNPTTVVIRSFSSIYDQDAHLLVYDVEYNIPKDNGAFYEVKDSNGSTVIKEQVPSGPIQIRDLDVGQYTITITNPETVSDLSSSATAIFKIRKPVYAEILVNSVTYGEATTISIYGDDGTYLVSLNDDITVEIEVIKGQGKKSVYLEAGTYKTHTRCKDPFSYLSLYEAVFNVNGPVYDEPSIITADPDVGETVEDNSVDITIVPRLIVVSGDLTADYLENPPYVFQAMGDDGNPVGENETVKVVFAGSTIDLKTNATGHVVRTIGLAPGMYAVKACYKGYNTTATVFVVKQILKVTSGALKKTAKSYTLKATLKNSNGKAIAGKEVKLTFNGKTYNATTNSKGVASYKIGSKIIKKLKAGKTYTLQARYVNDIAKGKIKVEK